MQYKLLALILISSLQHQTHSADDTDYNVLNTDGSYDFRYDNPDSYHESHANRNNVVNGVFGGRNPSTGRVDRTEYTAGPRGFRPKGNNVVRKYDLSQRRVGPIGSKDDPYYDPYEDPSYNFQFNTRVYNRKEGANRFGDVKGSYTYLDDVGDKHEVEYIAGKNTGFHVKSPHPDSYPNSYRTLYFKDPRKPYMRGRSFVQRGLDGSYRFAALGPDHRRTEVSDSVGNVRGSYTYQDEKGVQHSVHYIAGPNIGYRVLKNVKAPHLPSLLPFNSPGIVPSDFYESKESDLDVFTQAASTYVTPKPSKDQDKFPLETEDNQIDKTTNRPAIVDSATVRPPKPSQGGVFGAGSEDGEEELFDDLFNSGSRPAPGKPGKVKPSTYRPPIGGRPGLGGVVTSKPPSGFEQPQSSKPSGSFGQSQSSKPAGSFGQAQSSLGKPPGAFGQSESPFGKPPGAFGESSKPAGAFGQSESSFGQSQRPDSTTFWKPRPRPPTASNERPSSSSGEDLFDISQSGTGSDIFQQRPTPSTSYGSRPSAQKPRPPSPTSAENPLLQFELAGPNGSDRYHTIITNYGDTVFTAPPGVPVRAHVQSIGLVPLLPRSPSPSEQFNVDISSEEAEEDAQAAANMHDIRVPSTSSTITTTALVAPSVIAHTTTQRADTTTSGGTTTDFALFETTTTASS